VWGIFLAEGKSHTILQIPFIQHTLRSDPSLPHLGNLGKEQQSGHQPFLASGYFGNSDWHLRVDWSGRRRMYAVNLGTLTCAELIRAGHAESF
jgi:hypothetical protein